MEESLNGNKDNVTTDEFTISFPDGQSEAQNQTSPREQEKEPENLPDNEQVILDKQKDEGRSEGVEDCNGQGSEAGNSISFGYIKKAFNLPDTDIKTYSPLTLAFIGDSVFDLIIRSYVVESGNAPVNKLHHRCSKLVQAGAQAELFHSIKDKLTEEEMAVFKRGRNAKSFTTAKNAGLLEYKTATGLEALIGYLYLTGRIDRIMELIKQHIAVADMERKN